MLKALEITKVKVNEMELTEVQKQALEKARKHVFSQECSFGGCTIIKTRNIIANVLQEHFNKRIYDYTPDFLNGNDTLYFGE